MQNTAKQKAWEKTKTQSLLRHQSGYYYAITYATKKQIWKSLRTKHYSVAQARLAEYLKDHRRRVARIGPQTPTPRMTCGEALQLHRRNQADNGHIKPSTR